MKKIKFIILIIFISGSDISCRKDKPPEKNQQPISIGSKGGVFITNEGNFQFENAKISYYNSEKDSVVEDIFYAANNIPLGDVCQSLYFFNEKIYIVVNNSGKIVVVNKNDFKIISTINGFISPRYFLPVSNGKAYVTDLFSNEISIVDLSNNAISGKISCNGWTEELLMIYGKVFVTNLQKEFLYVINSSNDFLEDSIKIGYGSNSIVQDKNGKIWVLCSGNQSNKKASLQRVNPSSKQVEKTFEFANISDSPWRLRMNGTNDTLYFLNKDVFRMEINSNSLPTTAFISQGTKNFYGIGIEPTTGILYVSDAIDYVQKGKIYRYKSDGTFINSFLAGIIPNDFYFQ